MTYSFTQCAYTKTEVSVITERSSTSMPDAECLGFFTFSVNPHCYTTSIVEIIPRDRIFFALYAPKKSQ